MRCRLAEEKATAILAQYLARAVEDCGLRVLLFTGPLGSGKTHCIRAIVQELPGSAHAEVASPSFSICNRYPVTPPVLHCDLYRTGSSVPEEILEALEDPHCAVFVEWAEFLPENLRPQAYLALRLSVLGPSERLVTMEAFGDAEKILQSLTKKLAADHPELFI
ncbi:MAG: tRNA (adenosine(37)-N6)-threonylcarbamoyltransferase complex ATPase subunit type 1 TsaE [Desulfovibrionaceae bacterium]|nr:tRNA (adenosine(37)-N6)-threonylcarbamoyltransferase complex ATPase subunit type 1 TsaE [Desulfovibrionaceae bacterium]